MNSLKFTFTFVLAICIQQCLCFNLDFEKTSFKCDSRPAAKDMQCVGSAANSVDVVGKNAFIASVPTSKGTEFFHCEPSSSRNLHCKLYDRPNPKNHTKVYYNNVCCQCTATGCKCRLVQAASNKKP